MAVTRPLTGMSVAPPATWPLGMGAGPIGVHAGVVSGPGSPLGLRLPLLDHLVDRDLARVVRQLEREAPVQRELVLPHVQVSLRRDGVTHRRLIRVTVVHAVGRDRGRRACQHADDEGGGAEYRERTLQARLHHDSPLAPVTNTTFWVGAATIAQTESPQRFGESTRLAATSPEWLAVAPGQSTVWPSAALDQGMGGLFGMVVAQ